MVLRAAGLVERRQREESRCVLAFCGGGSAVRSGRLAVRTTRRSGQGRLCRLTAVRN